ncbi:P-loop containing nucleoside triphosphate hydrolase protein [Xylaria cf. heliscus]|nr:P-loop containing nucleoside triphosphate hydrolase protein [Xylaria cf. heliscus]
MERPVPVAGPEYKEELEIIQTHTKFYSSPSPDLPEWRSYPEIPTARDLNPDWQNAKDLERINSLLPNNWEHPFPDKNTYLETHYRLQREEAIAILRYSVKKYREDPTMVDDDETCIYTKVFVQGYLMTRLGPMCRIQFSTQRAGKKIRWTQTRRLTTGSLVAISTAADGFRTLCIPAVIADHPIRDGLDRNPPTIQIFWGSTDDAVLDPTVELVMLESRSGYFEAVRHCMVGLQHVASTETTLDKYLVSLDKSDLAAEYVRENPKMNISSLVHHIPGSSTLPVETVRQRLVEARDLLRNHQVLDGIDGKISTYTNLDNSQLSAVHRILTKELGIIQGPPGTGKTFTSVQALQILLDSQRERGSNVIIVAAQTNHAVDQILSQLINLGFNTVRLGGRTQSEEIKRYNMYNLRRRAMPPRAHKADGDYKAFEAARRKTITRIEELVASIFSDELIDPEALQTEGIITQKQLGSLLAEDGWAHASSADGTSGVLSQWLGDQRVEAPSMDVIDPDFDIQESDDTADFDAEDYDIELDDCIADDDENSGRVEGRWVPIKYQWTGANPRQYTEADLVIRKELKRENLWDINEGNRGAIYQYWQRELLRLQLARFRAELTSNARICRNLKANRWHKDLRCIRMAQIEIVGCTTTGLCKYRGLLAALKPRTMLIEEAAETKEASILSALYPSLQQLILVGDHQQLKPSCDTPFLDEAPYYIRVSMFERLVALDMPYTMLNMQRRMSPILREVLNPFYPNLQDHPVVCQPDARPLIPGMAQQSFFFHHTWSEGTDENLSKFNLLESEMIVRFIDYLMMNGVKGSEITVLTFYRGQRKKILSEFRKMKHREPFKNVHTVDSYQGEENDIVILSLVRSNGPEGPHKAGFLRDSNRGVVAISRARRGFYLFGNMINLWEACDESRKMWGAVLHVFRRQNRFGETLPITCQQHGRTTWIRHPDEWINYHGGCAEPCEEKFECGHDCGRRCHWVQHSRLICLKACERVLSCGHRCEMYCGEGCHCQCAAFTGAYPNDEAWDDNMDRNRADECSSTPRCVAAPFTGSDGRIGRIRSDYYGPRGRRSGFTRSGKSAHVSNQVGTQGYPVRSNMLGRKWAVFDARQHDAQQRQEYRQSSDPICPSPHDDQDPLSMINPIRETFRQVTLNPSGFRNVKEGVISENSRTPSPEKIENGTLENNNASDQTQRTGDLVSFRDVVQTENPVYTDPTQQQKVSAKSLVDPYSTVRERVDPSTFKLPDAPKRHSPFDNASPAANPPQRNVAMKTLPGTRNHGPDGTRNANRARVVEDRPEWEESSSTIYEDGKSDLHDVTEEGEGNLIEL